MTLAHLLQASTQIVTTRLCQAQIVMTHLCHQRCACASRTLDIEHAFALFRCSSHLFHARLPHRLGPHGCTFMCTHATAARRSKADADLLAFVATLCSYVSMANTEHFIAALQWQRSLLAGSLPQVWHPVHRALLQDA